TISLAFFSSRVSVIGALLFLGMPQFSHALPKNRNAPRMMAATRFGQPPSQKWGWIEVVSTGLFPATIVPECKETDAPVSRDRVYLNR
ncbi:MAG: hypothetical protein ROW39_01705, partial [Anaerolineaceae bacterium]